MRRLLFVPTLAATALILAACGGEDAEDGPAGDTATAAMSVDAAGAGGASSEVALNDAPPTTTAEGAKPNEADVLFAQSMIPHHEQAVEMAEIALDPAAGASVEVAGLAEQIQDAQGPEIRQMRAWLQAWGETEQPGMSEDHAAHGMDGMMSAEAMAELGRHTGTDFDRVWMELMIRHHEGAIAMAETVLQEGSLADVEALANGVIDGQQVEINEMSSLLEEA